MYLARFFLLSEKPDLCSGSGALLGFAGFVFAVKGLGHQRIILAQCKNFVLLLRMSADPIVMLHRE